MVAELYLEYEFGNYYGQINQTNPVEYCYKTFAKDGQ